MPVSPTDQLLKMCQSRIDDVIFVSDQTNRRTAFLVAFGLLDVLGATLRLLLESVAFEVGLFASLCVLTYLGRYTARGLTEAIACCLLPTL